MQKTDDAGVYIRFPLFGLTRLVPRLLGRRPMSPCILTCEVIYFYFVQSTMESERVETGDDVEGSGASSI